MADQVTTNAKALVERLFDPRVQDNVTKRARALVAALGDAAGMTSERAASGWRDAEPIRRDAARAAREALRQASRTWQKDLLPNINRLWDKRTVALSAAGAAVPVARELIDDAAVRMGIREHREQRHWGSFFFGLLLGAAGGLIAAILTAPKAGRQMRDELAVTAKDAATRAREVASIGAKEVAARAREAAETAGEWVPIFQRPDGDGDLNGGSIVEPIVVEPIPTPKVTPPAATRKRAAKPTTVDKVE